MNIREWGKRKSEMEDALYQYLYNPTHQVEKRWKKLIGLGCGYFNSWNLEGENVVVYYERPRQGGPDTDNIPIRFFEIEDDDKAAAAYREFSKTQKEKEQEEYRIEKEKEDRKLLQRLKNKYEK